MRSNGGGVVAAGCVVCGQYPSTSLRLVPLPFQGRNRKRPSPRLPCRDGKARARAFRGIQEPTMADTFHTLTMTLADGDVTIKLRPDLAPNHVERIAM